MSRLDLTTPYSRTLHVLAWCTAIATFPLIWMGGLVTSHGVGLAVPDWPNSFGYNMFLLPWDIWSQWGVFYEHTHRLLGTVVGFFAILLVAVAWMSKNATRTQRWLAVAVLAAVVLQGVMGGLRVVWVSLHLAITHGIFAQMALCLMGLMIVVSSRWWRGAPKLISPALVPGGRDFRNEANSGGGVVSRNEAYFGEGISSRNEANFGGERCPGTSAGLIEEGVARSLRRLATVTVGLILAQLIVGALMRHNQAGLAIPDLPLHYGELLPPSSADGLAAANASRLDDPRLGQVTLTQVWLHFGHRFGAVVVTIALVWLITRVLRSLGRFAEFGVPAISLVLLLIVQLTLGVLTVLWRKPADIASLHVAVGALLLLVTFILAVRIYRVFRADAGVEPRGFPVAPDDRTSTIGARAIPT